MSQSKIVLLLSALTLSATALANGRVVNVAYFGDSLGANELGPAYTLEPKLKELGGGIQYHVKAVSYCGISPSGFTSNSGQSRCGYLEKSENGKPIVHGTPKQLEPSRDSKGRPRISIKTGKPIMIPIAVKGPQLQDVMQGFNGGSKKADVVVVQLGTNLYDSLQSMNRKAAKEAIKKDCLGLMNKILAINSNAKIQWMAPPEIRLYNGREVTPDQKLAMWEAIREATGENKGGLGAVKPYDSRKVTKPPTSKDGTHPETVQTAWQNATASEVIKLVHAMPTNWTKSRSNRPADYQADSSKPTRNILNPWSWVRSPTVQSDTEVADGR